MPTSNFTNHFELFLDYKERRDQTVRFISKMGTDRNIIDYVKGSVDRMNEYHKKPGFKEDWQTNIFDPKTRDKVISILGNLAAARMKPELLLKPNSIFNHPGLKARQRIYSDLLDAANYKNQEEQKLIWEMYTGLSEGTVIGFEGWKRDTRDVEYVKNYDPNTGKREVEKIKYDAWDDVYGEIVPIDEFYPETIWTNDFVNGIKRCFWVKEMTEAAFKDTYGKFKNASTVKQSSMYVRENQLPWGITDDVNPQNVQVIHFYDEVAGKMGIWANTEELYWGPLPWNHGKKPFWLAIAEPIHHQFLYGKSLPDKLMSMQDVNNAILNGMLDQLFLAVNSPIFADGLVDLEEGYLEPGRVYDVEPGTRIERVSMGQNDPANFQLLSLIQRSMEETSVSAQTQGVPTGGRKTKFEVQQLQAGALNIAGMFLAMMEGSIGYKYWLRMHNILQYYSMPNRDKNGNKRFKYIVSENRELSNGKTGKKMIQIVNNESEAPNKNDLEVLAEREEGKPFNALESKVEPIVVTRDYFLNRDFDLEMRIIPNSSVKDSQADKDNKGLTWYQLTNGDPMVNQFENKKNLAKTLEQPEELVKEPQPGQQQQPGVPGEQESPALPPELAGLLGGEQGV